MPNIPDYLLFMIGGIVIFPTFLAIVLRICLYQEISREIKVVRKLIKFPKSGSPAFICLLETRFANASSNLEQVNTGALIDQLYSNTKVGVFSREWVDNFCRVLPNLLLAFGLMGTFLGITINLVSLSETITQAGVNGNINSLVVALQKPLEGMGIAFTTSLAGLICSALLTIANLIWNTALAKYQLVSLLEDYLDNIFHPTLQGQTRLDTIVKEMAATFDNFLTRFGQTVRDGIESALAEKIEQLMEANLKAATLAEQVYSRLADASGTIATGADRLHTAADTFAQAASTVESSNFAQKLSEAVVSLEATQNNFAESTTGLVNAEGNFSSSISELTKVTTALEKSLQKIDSLNQQIVNFLSGINDYQGDFLNALKLSKSGQQQLSESIPVLHEAINEIGNLSESIPVLHEAINKIGNLEEASKEIQEVLKELRELSRKLAQNIIWREPTHERPQGFINKNEPIPTPPPEVPKPSVNWKFYQQSSDESDISPDQIDVDRVDWSLIDALDNIDNDSNKSSDPWSI